MVGIADYALKFLGSKENANNFCFWAFGKEYQDLIGTINFINAWNERHGDKFLLNKNGNPGEDIQKMIELYHKEKDEIIEMIGTHIACTKYEGYKNYLRDQLIGYLRESRIEMDFSLYEMENVEQKITHFFEGL